ncbi:hypothetical protein [Pseudoalteromonas sp. T1lg88]|uniref:hypothetical protein n=1 Tax=Pseudoalteromonas sp. T1lg88 TaxID=2077104 RepID=UPI000CF748B1|nr:hypothetical protein [Pseudoalteromonas sp. T1lg88]
MNGYRILPLALALVHLTGCDFIPPSKEEVYKPFISLKEKYSKQEKPQVPLSPVDSLLFQSIHHPGVLLSSGSTSGFALNQGALYIDTKNTPLGSFEISAKNIRACTCLSFGSGEIYTEVLLAEEGLILSLGYSGIASKTIDWCYANNKPVISNSLQRDWLYDKRPLPDFDNYTQVSRKLYDEQYKQACQGF